MLMNPFEAGVLVYNCTHEVQHETFLARRCRAASPEVNSTWWVIGPSTLQHFAYVTGVLRAPAWRDEAEQPSHFERQPWAWREVGRAARHGRELSCLHAGGRRLCYVPMGTPDGNWAVTTVHEALRRLVAAGQTKPSDVALVLFGTHLMGRGAEADQEHLRLVQAFADEYARAPPLRLLWIEQLAQHFPTEDGTYHGRRKYGPRCVALGHGTTRPEVLVRVAATLRAARIPVVPAWSLTRNASAHHPGRARGELDCTHYCLFSGVHESLLNHVDCVLERGEK